MTKRKKYTSEFKREAVVVSRLLCVAGRTSALRVGPGYRSVISAFSSQDMVFSALSASLSSAKLAP